MASLSVALFALVTFALAADEVKHVLPENAVCTASAQVACRSTLRCTAVTLRPHGTCVPCGDLPQPGELCYSECGGCAVGDCVRGVCEDCQPAVVQNFDNADSIVWTVSNPENLLLDIFTVDGNNQILNGVSAPSGEAAILVFFPEFNGVGTVDACLGDAVKLTPHSELSIVWAAVWQLISSSTFSFIESHVVVKVGDLDVQDTALFSFPQTDVTSKDWVTLNIPYTGPSTTNGQICIRLTKPNNLFEAVLLMFDKIEVLCNY